MHSYLLLHLLCRRWSRAARFPYRAAGAVSGLGHLSHLNSVFHLCGGVGHSLRTNFMSLTSGLTFLGSFTSAAVPFRDHVMRYLFLAC